MLRQVKLNIKKKLYANGLKSCVYKVRGGNSTKTTATYVKPLKSVKEKSSIVKICFPW